MKPLPSTSLLFITFVLFVAVLFGGAHPVSAQGPFGGDTVPAGQTVDHDLILSGSRVTVDGTVNGDVFAVGEAVDVNGDVAGSLFVISPEANVKGRVDGSVYAAVVNMILAPTSTLGRDLHLVGVSLATGAGSQIARNLEAVAVGAQLSGDIGGQARAILGPLEIGRWVMGQTGWKELLPRSQAQPEPTPPATSMRSDCAPRPATAGLRFASWSPTRQVCAAGEAALTPAARLSWTVAQQPEPADTGKVVLGHVQSWIALVVVGLLLLWLARGWMEAGADIVPVHPFAAAGWGLLIAVNGFLLSLVLAIAIGAVGFGLGAVGLYGLRTVVWLLGYGLLGAAFAVFLLALLFVSKIVVAYWLGRLLLRRMAGGWLQRILALLLGLVIFVILAAIPVLGGLVSLLVSLVGLGALWLVARSHWPRATSAETALAPVEAEPV